MQYPPGYRLLPWFFALVAITWGTCELMDRIGLTGSQSLDERIIRFMRRPEQPERMIGPPAFEEAMRDFTALGGYAVLLTTTVCFATFARAELGREMFRFFVVTVVTGFLWGVVIKEAVQRDRPSIVPHLSHVSGSTSFPSSHAMMSIVVYVTIGLLLAQLSRSSALRHLLIALPFGVSLLVGGESSLHGSPFSVGCAGRLDVRPVVDVGDVCSARSTPLCKVIELETHRNSL